MQIMHASNQIERMYIYVRLRGIYVPNFTFNLVLMSSGTETEDLLQDFKIQDVKKKEKRETFLLNLLEKSLP